MTTPQIIAIDGPAASGKTTLAQSLAHELNYLYFDTGVMYRAVTLAVLREHIDLTDQAAIGALASRIVIDVMPPAVDDGRSCTVFLDGKDVTGLLRSAEVDANVSVASTYVEVRHAMTVQQRRIGERGRIVMVGRDIGTVVLPHADLKIYLDASLEARARRRWQEYQSGNRGDTYEDVLNAMKKRDKVDSLRALAPLRPAPDAIVIDSTSLQASDVLKRVLKHIHRGDESSAPSVQEEKYG
jgi:cytidylate kinase